MHKARENANGSFSVGKTWNFEELTIIESFTNRQPRTQEEAQQQAWAGDTGFTVTISKPYFWNTNSTREKSFFIGSLAKVFKRYSGGQLPDLVGFTKGELDQIYAHIDRNSGAPPGGLSSGPPSRHGPQPPVPTRGGAVQQFQESPNMSFDSRDSPQPIPPLAARKVYSSQETFASQSPTPDSLRGAGLRQVQSRDGIYTSSPQRPFGSQATQSSESLSREATPESVRVNNRRGGGFYQPPAVPATEDPVGNGLGISSRGANGDLNSRGKLADSP
jgi:hypothetical protein